ncbi:MAG TPA: GNAT family N-acetyltransferase [Afifellaceae bacterium]|nr:GNAT family N-acetyltransferase [Afifellaceae bacterium]
MHGADVLIRPAAPADAPAIWAILEPVIREGETYALPRDMTYDEALAYWMAPVHEVFVAEEGGAVLGTYTMRPNQPGGGSHVANCGYVVARAAEGRGIARAMAEHSLAHARQRGYRAMQYNFVIVTNERAVRLWQALGFDIVGRLPGAFNHPRSRFVDALVMYRVL